MQRLEEQLQPCGFPGENEEEGRLFGFPSSPTICACDPLIYLMRAPCLKAAAPRVASAEHAAECRRASSFNNGGAVIVLSWNMKHQPKREVKQMLHRCLGFSVCLNFYNPRRLTAN